MSVFAKLFSATPAIKKCEVQKIISDKPGAKSFDLILMSSKESSHVENKNTFSLWSFIHWIYCLTLFTIHKSRHLEIKNEMRDQKILLQAQCRSTSNTNLKVIAFLECDDFSEDIRIKTKYWPPPRHFWYPEPFKSLKVAWRIKNMTKSRASFRIVK
jgi:hypothetical protein